MPYGVAKDQGGDSQANDAWMEKCVSSVMKGGKSKGSAIAICKTTLATLKKKRKD
jgi:ribosomal protein S7